MTEVPKERWNPELYYDPAGKAGEKIAKVLSEAPLSIEKMLTY